jgi:hypothetical protein
MNDNIKSGADIHAGDGGYSIGTEEKYNEFAKGRNQSMGKMRIKELMPKPWTFPYPDRELYTKEQFEKFAELIVREMLVTCEEHPAWTGRMIGNQIKEHFGVEE